MPSLMRMESYPRGLSVVIRDLDTAWKVAAEVDAQVSAPILASLRDRAQDRPTTDAEVAQVHGALDKLNVTLEAHRQARAALQVATQVPDAMQPAPSRHRSVDSLAALAQTVDEDAAALRELADDERWR